MTTTLLDKMEALVLAAMVLCLPLAGIGFIIPSIG